MIDAITLAGALGAALAPGQAEIERFAAHFSLSEGGYLLGEPVITTLPGEASTIIVSGELGYALRVTLTPAEDGVVAELTMRRPEDGQGDADPETWPVVCEPVILAVPGEPASVVIDHDGDPARIVGIEMRIEAIAADS